LLAEASFLLSAFSPFVLSVSVSPVNSLFISLGFFCFFFSLSLVLSVFLPSYFLLPPFSSLSPAFYRLSCVRFDRYLPRIMIRSGTLCFGGIGTPTVLSSLDYWWRFPRPGGNLVAVEKSRLERGQMLCIWSTLWSCYVDRVVVDLCFFLLQVAFFVSRGRRRRNSACGNGVVLG